MVTQRAEPTLELEHQLLEFYDAVIGVDEVGRGAVAGPVAVGVQMVLPGTEVFPEGLRDSKLLTPLKRERMVLEVEQWGIGAVGYASAREIDEHGIAKMLGEAGARALAQLGDQGVPLQGAVLLVDGTHDWMSPRLAGSLPVTVRPKADRDCASVAAASVRAKVARDRLMQHADRILPYYGWASNKGYGAKAHYEGIEAHGLTTWHRASWIHR